MHYALYTVNHALCTYKVEVVVPPSPLLSSAPTRREARERKLHLGSCSRTAETVSGPSLQARSSVTVYDTDQPSALGWKGVGALRR